METENTELQWYWLGCTSGHKELKVRDEARNYGLEAFVPLKYAYKNVRKQTQRTLVPAIAGLMFVRGTEEQVKDFIDGAKERLYMRKSTYSNHEAYLVIPDRAMMNFIAATEDHDKKITYFRPDEIELQPGDRIKVRGGMYDGKEGVIMRIKGKRNKHLVVQIPGIIIAAIELSPDLIELRHKPVEEADPATEKPSRNVPRDKRLLKAYAQRLLFDFSDHYKENTEYLLLLSELKRCVARLAPIKGFTPATEAELALPLYMAALVTQEGVAAARERLEKATDKLRHDSQLKQECEDFLRNSEH